MPKQKNKYGKMINLIINSWRNSGSSVISQMQDFITKVWDQLIAVGYPTENVRFPIRNVHVKELICMNDICNQNTSRGCRYTSANKWMAI